MTKQQNGPSLGGTHTEEHDYRIVLFLIICLGLALRLWHITWGLPEFYEEGMPLKISWQFWNWDRTGFDFNPHFFTYPALTFYLEFCVQGIQFVIGHVFGSYPDLEVFHHAYTADFSTFVVIARLVAVTFDMGTIIVIYILGMRVADRRVGLVAAALVAINVLHVDRSHLINVDTPLAFFSILSVLFVFMLYKEGSIRWYIWSGISVGLAAATKYNGGILIISLILAHALRSKSFGQGIASLKSGLLLASILASGFVFVLCNPYILIQFHEFSRQFFEVERHMELGHLSADPSTNAFQYYFFQSFPYNLGLPFSIIVLLSFVYLAVRTSKMNIILLSFPALYLATIASWAMKADRYLIPAIPILMLVGTVGTFKFWSWTLGYLKTRRSGTNQGSKILPASAAIITGLLVFVPSFFTTLQYHHTLSLPDTRTITANWIASHFPRNSAIATGPYGLNLPTNRYLLIPIAFNAGRAEVTFPYYDERWYEDLDLLVTSDYDYGRYVKNPLRFHKILPFYDSLRLKWTLVYQITPAESLTGPSFWIYKYSHLPTEDTFDTSKIRTIFRDSDSSEAVDFMGRLALVMSIRGKLTKSEQLLRELIEVDPNHPYAARELVFVEGGLGRPEEALMWAERYLRVNPRDAIILSKKGGILVSLKRLEEAEKVFTESLNLDENREEPYQGLIAIYSLRNDRQKAVDILSRYARILPQGSEKRKLINDELKRLGGIR